jgi:hypothetical protein
VQVQPAALLFVVDKVGAVALPQGQTEEVVIAQAVEQQAGGQEAGTGGLAVLGHFHHVGGQGVHGHLTHGAGVEPAEVRIGFGIVGIAHEALGVIVGDGVVPDLREAAHNAEGVAPGSLLRGVPEPAPLFQAEGLGVEIAVTGVEVFRSLGAFCVVDALAQCQLGLHSASSFR